MLYYEQLKNYVRLDTFNFAISVLGLLLGTIVTISNGSNTSVSVIR